MRAGRGARRGSAPPCCRTVPVRSSGGKAMARIKVGIIGCGAIAQIQHLPHLRELDDEFEIAGLADLSPKLLEAVGPDYGVPAERQFLDYREMVRSDIDAVIVC